MNRRQLVFGAAGTIALLGALAAVLLPDPPGFVVWFGTSLTGPVVVVVLAVVFALLGLREGYGTTIRRVDEPPFDQPPETAVAHDGAQPGADIDEPYKTLAEEGVYTTGGYQYTRSRLQSDLKEAAVDVVADAEGISPQTARIRIDDGHWADDPRASAFLSGETETLPLEMRIRDWLSGEGLERHVERTIDELRSLASVPEEESRDDSAGNDVTAETADIRGGGIDAGEISITDHTHSVSTTVTSADSETNEDSHWSLGMVVAFLLAGIGFVLSNVTLVLAAIVPASFSVYGSVTRPPEANLDVERTISDTSPVPGEPVRVTVSVTNIGERAIAEVRVIDGVPDGLRVVDGSPRLCDSLDPDASASTTYTVTAQRGSYDFEGVSVWTRNVTGEVERTVTADLSETLRCRETIESMPTTRQTTPYQGRIETDVGGAGLEFYATREYQANDPLNRIDWNYWAQSGDPRTVEFRQTKAGTVVIVLDDRAVSKKSKHDHTPDAVALGRYAAVRIADALLDESNAVGGAMLTTRAYERPGRGREQSQLLRSFFERSPDDTEQQDDDHGSSFSLEDIEGRFFQGTGYDEGDTNTGPTFNETMFARDGGGIAMEWLRRRLPSDAQVVFISPLLDEAPRRFLRTLQADGSDVTVLSPNVTSEETPGGTVARIERHERIRGLRRRQFRIVDWDTDTPLAVALDRAQHRWSR